MVDKKKIIAIDLDDVISTNAADFVAFSNEHYGTNLSVDDYHEHWGDMWNVSIDEVRNRLDHMIESNHMAHYGIIDDAYDTLSKLKESYNLTIVTSRLESVKDVTQEWLDKNFPNIFDDLILTGFYDNVPENSWERTKGGLVKELSADYLIDDQLKHVASAAEHGVTGLLFGSYSWNQTDSLPENVTRVLNWKEIEGYFSK